MLCWHSHVQCLTRSRRRVQVVRHLSVSEVQEGDAAMPDPRTPLKRASLRMAASDDASRPSRRLSFMSRLSARVSRGLSMDEGAPTAPGGVGLGTIAEASGQRLGAPTERVSRRDSSRDSEVAACDGAQ